MAGHLGPTRLLWGRGRVPRPRTAAVEAWLGPWAPCHVCEGVAGPLCPVWPPWKRGRALGPRVVAVGSWQVPWGRVATVGAWLVL